MRWGKRVRAWSAATVAAGLIAGGVTAAPAAAEGDEEPAVLNGSFEDWTTVDSWVASDWSMTTTVWVSSTAARTGTYSQALGQWNDNTTLSQTLTAPEGTYDVSLFVWANESLGTSALVANGKSAPIVSNGAEQIDGTLTWDEIVVEDVPVGADGELTIEIVIPELTSATLAGYIDDVSVKAAGGSGEDLEPGESVLVEPGFEDGGSSWSIGGDLLEGGRGDSAYSVAHASSGSQETSQTVTGLAEGYYRFTAWVQNDGAYEQAYLYASGGEGSDALAALPRTNFPYDAPGTWKKTTLRGVHVTDGTLEVGLRTDGAIAGSVVIDDLALIQDGGPYDLLVGGDISALTYTEDLGGRYADASGRERDPLEILADNGWNIVRIRVYNDPGKGHGDGNYYVPAGYVNADDALELARRSAAAGLQIQLSFHYSDYWTNPGIQMIPSAWQDRIEGKSDAEAVDILETELHDYTKDLLDRMAAQGTTPEYVSIGNETRSGMLFPYGATANWDNLARFYNAGAEAVREAAPEAKVIIHLDDGGNTATYQTYFTNADARNVDYDIIGTSYYPFWTNKSASKFAEFATTITQQFDKPIMVMETGFNWNATTGAGLEGQLRHNGPYGDAGSSTPELQRDFMIELFNELQGVPGGMAIGDLYWDPIQIYAGGQTGWAYFESTDRADINAIDNTTLFDFDGKALPVLDAYAFTTRGVTSGALAGTVVDSEGTPVAGATVTLAADGAGDRTAVTNEYGDYYFAHTTPGDHTLAAEKAGLGVATTGVAASVTAGSTTEVQLQLTAAQELRQVSGTVEDEHGAPLAGALLRLEGGEYSSPRLAAADGAYAFPDVPDGTYTLTVTQDGYVPSVSEVTVNGGDVVRAVSLIADIGMVSGHVFGPGDTPLSGAVVRAGDRSTTSAEDGSYVLTEVPSGNGIVLTASHGGYLDTMSNPVTVEHSETTSGVEIVLPESVAVVNGGFETAGAGGEATAEGWTFTSDPAGALIRQDREYFGGTVEGTYAATFWLDSDFTASLSQAVTASAPGTYVARAYVYVGVTGTATMRMTDQDGTVIEEKQLARNSGPQEVELSGAVTGTEFSITFDVDGVSGDWAVIDAVTAGYLGDAAKTEFSDVTETNTAFFTEISWLASEGISQGWSNGDGTFAFRPFNQITRDAMAAFLYRLAGSPDVDLPAVSPFSDVTPTNTKFYDAIVWMYQEGISTGWSNGDGTYAFKPFEPISRDAIAAFLYRYADVTGWTGPAVSPFTDVTSTNTKFYAEITWLADTGITTGWADGTFRPFNNVTRDAMAAFLYRFAGM